MLKSICFVLLLCFICVNVTAFANITVSGVGLPAVLASPTSDQGVALTRSMTVTSMTLANNTSSAQTITIQDCQTTPFQLFDGTNGSSIAAGDKWFISGPIRFSGCFKWAASSTSVQGTLTGVQ